MPKLALHSFWNMREHERFYAPIRFLAQIGETAGAVFR